MAEFTPIARDGRPLESFIGAADIAARVAELGQRITEDHRALGGDLVLIGVLKGSVIFLADLCRRIELPISIDFIGIASYGDETQSSGVVQITSDLTRPIEGRHVIVVEDIIDTGLTAHYLLDNLATRHPASLKLCSLLHKPDRAVQQVTIDYLGFTIPNAFVVGYGLDYAQQYRNLPFIARLEGE
ncbi:MAG TPA: hypoxanthine phosphoribosyltransferase [Candidatus Acidoferrum sp.]|nr:hypoxanthine phosphoribosyltransferase [Candidatus Acidoferrum sp.]